MGGATSNLTPEDIEELTQEGVSQFSPAEIKKLYKRFEALDRSHSGFISTDELELIPELSLNPMRQRVIELFDPSGRDTINFFDFVRILWVFSDKCAMDQKLRVAFDCYDLDKDGVIDESDMFGVLRDMVGQNLNKRELTVIAREMIRDNEMKHPPRGSLTMEEFFDAIGSETLLEKMTVPFGKQLY